MQVNKRKLLCWMSIAAGVYTLFPFLYIAQYNQPAADDFILAVRDRSIDFTTVFKDVYLNWSGRYAASLISRLNPLISGSYLYYKLYPLLMISGFTFAVILLARELLKTKTSWLETLAISAIFIYLVFTQTPAVAEAFYWFSGSCIYQTSNIATLLLLTSLCRLERANSKYLKWRYFLTAALLCILITGCNEISMFIVDFIILSFAGYNRFIAKKSTNFYLSLLAICLVFGASSLTAPGNYSRLNEVQVYNKSVAFTFLGALSVGFLYLFKWGTSVLITTLFYLLFSAKLFKHENASQVVNHRVLLISAVSFVVTFFFLQVFIIWIAGGSSLGRTENVVYFFFLLGYFFNLHLFIRSYVPRKIIQHSGYRLISVVTVLLFFTDVFNLENNISSAYVDLITARAKKYDAELNERVAFVSSCTKDTCYVKPLSVIPKTIFFADIKSIYDTRGLWVNESYSKYMGKSFVVTTGKLPPVEPNIELIKQYAREARENILH